MALLRVNYSFKVFETPATVVRFVLVKSYCQKLELGAFDPDARVAPESVTSYEKVVLSGLALTVGQAFPIT